MHSGSDVLRRVQGKQAHDGKCSLARRSRWFCWAAGAVVTSRLQHRIRTCSLQLRAPCTHEGITLVCSMHLCQSEYCHWRADVNTAMSLPSVSVSGQRMICIRALNVLCMMTRPATVVSFWAHVEVMQLHAGGARNFCLGRSRTYRAFFGHDIST